MGKWEQILAKIEDDQYSYISFDIFDTLLLRPFWEPTDLFYFVGIRAKELKVVKSELEYLEKRKAAERIARIRCSKLLEDINLDEIYDYVKGILKCSADISNELKEHEKELELFFCYQRQSGYELYQRAVACKKKIILISDMYLATKEIQQILLQNGYDKTEKIYLSSEIRLGKYTGNLYRYVLKDLGDIKGDKILHIGDNYAADINMAQKSGLDTTYLMKTKDAYLMHYSMKTERFLPKRIENAILVNTVFDNPYCESFNNLWLEKVRRLNESFGNQIKDARLKMEFTKLFTLAKVKNSITKLFIRR